MSEREREPIPVLVNNRGGRVAQLREDLVAISHREEYGDFIRINQKNSDDDFDYQSVFIHRGQILELAELIKENKI